MIRKLIAWLILGLLFMGLGALVGGTSSHALLVDGTEFYGWDAAWRVALFFGAAWIGGTVLIGIMVALIEWAL